MYFVVFILVTLAIGVVFTLLRKNEEREKIDDRNPELRLRNQQIKDQERELEIREKELELMKREEQIKKRFIELRKKGIETDVDYIIADDMDKKDV